MAPRTRSAKAAESTPPTRSTRAKPVVDEKPVAAARKPTKAAPAKPKGRAPAKPPVSKATVGRPKLIKRVSVVITVPVKEEPTESSVPPRLDEGKSEFEEEGEEEVHETEEVSAPPPAFEPIASSSVHSTNTKKDEQPVERKHPPTRAALALVHRGSAGSTRRPLADIPRDSLGPPRDPLAPRAPQHPIHRASLVQQSRAPPLQQTVRTPFGMPVAKRPAQTSNSAAQISQAPFSPLPPSSPISTTSSAHGVIVDEGDNPFYLPPTPVKRGLSNLDNELSLGGLAYDDDDEDENVKPRRQSDEFDPAYHNSDFSGLLASSPGTLPVIPSSARRGHDYRARHIDPRSNYADADESFPVNFGDLNEEEDEGSENDENALPSDPFGFFAAERKLTAKKQRASAQPTAAAASPPSSGKRKRPLTPASGDKDENTPPTPNKRVRNVLGALPSSAAGGDDSAIVEKECNDPTLDTPGADKENHRDWLGDGEDKENVDESSRPVVRGKRSPLAELSMEADVDEEKEVEEALASGSSGKRAHESEEEEAAEASPPKTRARLNKGKGKVKAPVSEADESESEAEAASKLALRSRAKAPVSKAKPKTRTDPVHDEEDDDSDPPKAKAPRRGKRKAASVKPKSAAAKAKGKQKATAEEDDDEVQERYAREREARLAYFRKLDGKKLETEKVYVV